MTRTEEARELKKQGFKSKEIAEKMGISIKTVYGYLTGSGIRQQKRKFGEKVRLIIQKELSSFGLPLEWEDELMKMFAVYHYSARERGGNTRLDIQSLIQLLCRRYKIPTPRKLTVLTYQGRGARKKSSGYMDVLRIIDGVTPSKPIDYVQYFVEAEGLPEEDLSEAEELIKKIPKVKLQSRDPKVLAGAVLYAIHRPDNPKGKRIYTQKYIANKLEITTVALRNNWHILFAGGLDGRIGYHGGRIPLKEKVDKLERELAELKAKAAS